MECFYKKLVSDQESDCLHSAVVKCLTCVGVVAAVAAGPLTVIGDSRAGLCRGQGGLLGVHAGRGGLADVGRGGRERGAGATSWGSNRGRYSGAVWLGALLLLLLLLLVEPLELLGTRRPALFLHASLLFLTSAARALHGGRDLS